MSKKRIYTLFIIAIVFSMTSIIISIYCSIRLVEPIKWDMLGVLAGILSILVTILVGWQLYNLLSFDSRINKLKQEIQKESIKQLVLLKNESIKQSEALKKEISYKIDDTQAQLLYKQAIVEESLGQYNLCLKSLISSVDKAIDNPYISIEETEIIEKLLSDLIYKLKHTNQEIFLEQEVKERYISIIKKANLTHGNDILKYLLDINVYRS